MASPCRNRVPYVNGARLARPRPVVARNRTSAAVGLVVPWRALPVSSWKSRRQSMMDYRIYCNSDGRSSSTANDEPTRPLIKRPKVANAYKTLLSIDGGGLRGIIPTMVLLQLENSIKKYIINNPKECLSPEQQKHIHKVTDFDIDLTDYFDLVAGTSVGSLIAVYIASRGASLDTQKLNADASAALKKLEGGSGRNWWNPFSWFGNRADKEEVTEDVKERYCSERPGSMSAVRCYLHTYAATIFPQNKKRGWFGRIGSPEYPSDGLEDTLKTVFKDGKMSHLQKDCLVTSFDLGKNSACSFVFKAGVKPLMATVHTEVRQKPRKSASDQAGDPRENVAGDEWNPDIVYKLGTNYYLRDLCLASASAPTYFKPAVITPLEGPITEPLTLVDGGMIANNPVLQALTYSIETFTEEDPKGLAIFSLGCGIAYPPMKTDKDPGLLYWLESGYLLDILFAGGSEYVQAVIDYWLYRQAKLAYGQYVRIQIEAKPNTEEVALLSSMDNPKNMGKLEVLGQRVASSNASDIDDFVKHYIFATHRAD